MARNIQLTIENPCHENWDEMTPTQQGRFCASCQKQVVDFSNMSDSQIAAFFKKPSTGPSCGHFFRDQLDRNIEIPRKRIPWIKYFFQFALPAFLVSMKATAQGNVKIKKEEMVKVPPVKDTLDLLTGIFAPFPGKTTINGKVSNGEGEPVPFANIALVEGQKRTNIIADSTGNFKIENSFLAEKLILQVSAVGYEAKEIILSSDEPVYRHSVLIQLDHLQNGAFLKGEVMILGGISVSKCSNEMESKKRVETIEPLKNQDEILPMIKVYPNPVKAGASIHIACQEMEEGYYTARLVSTSGQQVFNRQIWVDSGAKLLDIDIPRVSPGIYILSFINSANKNYSERITVQ